jgi:hypothetical protein
MGGCRFRLYVPDLNVTQGLRSWLLREHFCPNPNDRNRENNLVLR